jgi:hypothetical protein
MPKHKYIESPEILLQLFEDYKVWCANNPRKKMVFVGKDGNKDYELLQIPYTMEGFKVFCFNAVGCIKHYIDNTDNAYSEYSTIITRIKNEIRADQITGGMVGQYNHTLTARLNGLVDKQEVDANVKVNTINANFGSAIQSTQGAGADTQ